MPEDKTSKEDSIKKLPRHYYTINKTYTTGEAAKVSYCSQQTIIRLFDNGDLKGFKVPGSRFRRIPHKRLCDFLFNNNIPTDKLENYLREKGYEIDDPKKDPNNSETEL